MDNENVIFQGIGVEISEDKSNPDFLNAKFAICDFNTNKNKVRLNRDTIESWVSTLVGTPLVAKIVKTLRGNDFGSHEMRVVSYKDKDGVHKKAVFDTSAFGVCTNTYIETAKDGNEYIYADYKVWKRFENATKIIQDRCENLHTSWEISVEDYTVKSDNGDKIKVIDKGRFIGLAMLGSNVEPAYDCSGLLEVASQDDNELNTALIQDIIDIERSDINNNTDKEVNMELKDNEVLENSEAINEQNNTSQSETEHLVDNSDVGNSKNTDDDKDSETSKCGDGKKKEKSECENDENKDNECSTEHTEISVLTDRDIRSKLYNAIKGCVDIVWLFPADGIAWIRDYDSRQTELEFKEYRFYIENDEVIIDGEPVDIKLIASPKTMMEQIAQKDGAITEMSAQIKNLSDEVSSLKPYKDKVEEIERSEREAEIEKNRKELSEYAISSGYITADELETSEDIKTMIKELNKTGIQSIISDRVVSALVTNKKEDAVVETSANKEQNSNVQLNLSALDSNEVSEKPTSENARKFIRSYIGR